MAWRCSGGSNLQLVENLAAAGILKTPSLIRAFKLVDRGNYAPRKEYEDSPQSIGFGATISAPHMHAYAMEYLQSTASAPTASILDVGCGSGYLSAILARFNPSAKIYAIDYIPELVELTSENLRKADADLLDSRRIVPIVGDGWKGHAAGAPYDAIHVGAAAEALPKSLIDQLAVGGKMLIPVGPQEGHQELILIERRNPGTNIETDFRIDHLMGVRYVPLVRVDR